MLFNSVAIIYKPKAAYNKKRLRPLIVLTLFFCLLTVYFLVSNHLDNVILDTDLFDQAKMTSYPVVVILLIYDELFDHMSCYIVIIKLSPFYLLITTLYAGIINVSFSLL